MNLSNSMTRLESMHWWVGGWKKNDNDCTMKKQRLRVPTKMNVRIHGSIEMNMWIRGSIFNMVKYD